MEEVWAETSFFVDNKERGDLALGVLEERFRVGLRNSRWNSSNDLIWTPVLAAFLPRSIIAKRHVAVNSNGKYFEPQYSYSNVPWTGFDNDYGR